MDKPIPEAVDLLREVSEQLEGLDCGACVGSMAPMEDLHGRIAAYLALTASQQPDHIVDATKMVAQQQGGGEVLARGWLHRRGPGDDYDLHDESSGAGKDCAKCVPCVILRADTAPPSAPVGVEAVRYDAGLLSDYGGGNVEWWQDYIRAELERAHDFYTEALAQQPAAEVVVTRDDDGEIVRVTQGGRVIAATTHAGGKQPAAVDKWRLVIYQSDKPGIWATDGNSFVWVAELATQHQEPTT